MQGTLTIRVQQPGPGQDNGTSRTVQLIIEDFTLSAPHAKLVQRTHSGLMRRMAIKTLWLNATNALMALDKTDVAAFQQALSAAELCDVILQPKGDDPALVFEGVRLRDARVSWLKLTNHFGWSSNES